MPDHTIYITAADAEKLRELIRDAQATEYRNSPYLKMLASELERSVQVQSKDVPPDVITMNSRALLRELDTGEEMEYTLVFPDDADPLEGRISILAPIGTAMLGYRVGDVFEWDTPEGKSKFQVVSLLYQPEREGKE